MRSLFFDIHSTVMNTVERAGYSITSVLKQLGIYKILKLILTYYVKNPELRVKFIKIVNKRNSGRLQNNL